MSTREDWEDLPDDAELAFLILEERLWAKVVHARTPVDVPFGEVQEPDQRIVGQEEHSYVENIKGYIDETGIDMEINVSMDEMSWDIYFSEFHGKVQYFKARLRTRAKMAFFAKPGEMVSLSDDYRQEIHYLLNRVRKVVHTSDLEQLKKDAILQKINELNDEVDQSTTKLGRYKAVWLEVTEALGEGAKNLEPAVEILERVGRIFGKARAETDPAQLPSPEAPKQLPGPAEEDE